MSDKYNKAPKASPLGTPKPLAELKAETVREMGRDTDGAYRFARRLDGKN